MLATTKQKEPLQVRAELLCPSRLPSKTQHIYHNRPVVAELIAHQCFLVILLIAALRLQISQCRTLPRIGIIGGGHIGAAIVVTLIKQGYPSELVEISTRQPEKLPRCEHLRSSESQQMYQNVVRFYDNTRLAKECDVILLCMSPSQLKSVGLQIKPTLRGPVFVVSTLGGVPTEHVVNTCGTRLVVRAGVNPLDPCFKEKAQCSSKATADLLLAKNATECFSLHQAVEIFRDKLAALSDLTISTCPNSDSALMFPLELAGWSSASPSVGALTTWNKCLEVLDQLLVLRRRRTSNSNLNNLLRSPSKSRVSPLGHSPFHAPSSSSSIVSSPSPTSSSTRTIKL